jgi:(2R)-ethylmalonyl-CoA mutase
MERSLRAANYQALTIRRMSEHRLPERDRPWMMRTYAGHSDAERSNELYRKNLAKGQTGLSVAFDLPTQTGYDPDAELARGEVGKVGVSIAHKGDMHTLFDGIPLGEMNTSMTINATAAWLLALYATVAEENGVERAALSGTTQNDIIKEYLSRGTYAFPPGPSMRLIADMVAFTVNEIPKWNPINVCSYHLQEAGATPVQETAYALSTAMAVLDEVKERGQVADEDFPKVFGRISFFVNAGVRFIEEHAKLRAMGRLWEEIGRNRYGVTEPKFLRLRYGVQVNSLGLTESQPENNVPRIVLEALAVTLGRDARARAIQLPAWNEALGLPRPWDQQWSLRIQQILANETDLLDYPDIFEGSKVMDGLVDELASGADAEMKQVSERGGAVEAVPYMKAQLVESNRERIARIERGEITVVGQNKFTESEDSPLTTGEDGGILTPDPEVERERIEALEQWKAQRDQGAVDAALEKLAEVARDESANIMPATIEAAKAGATTGEWAGVLRDKCDCGSIVYSPTARLKCGGVKSCGCLCGKSSIIHNLSKTKIYKRWIGIKSRCYNKNAENYRNYGGRGIKMCDEWRNDFMSFYNWAIHGGYRDDLKIDRIDVNGNYEQNNCRWATNKEQATSCRGSAGRALPFPTTPPPG